MELKERIVEAVKAHPGIRLRYIGYLVDAYHISLIKEMSELEKEGKIKSVPHSDLANMEYYNEWYPV